MGYRNFRCRLARELTGKLDAYHYIKRYTVITKDIQKIYDYNMLHINVFIAAWLCSIARRSSYRGTPWSNGCDRRV